MGRDYNHRNLIVWQRAQALAHHIIQLTHRLPKTWSNAIIARQIIASATSVGANIAEGHGRFTPGAHSNHLSIAKGSAAETDSWLDMLRREDVITAEEEGQLQAECLEVMAMLTSKILDLERLAQSPKARLREESEHYTEASDGLPPYPFVEADYV